MIMGKQERVSPAAIRDVGLVLKSYLAGDKKAVAHVLRTTEDKDDLILGLLIVTLTLVKQKVDPEAFVDDVLRLASTTDDPVNGSLSPTAAARDFLRRELADGKPHVFHDLYDRAVEAGVIPDSASGLMAMQNARKHIGAVSVRTSDGPCWRLSNRARQQAQVQRAQRLARR